MHCPTKKNPPSLTASPATIDLGSPNFATGRCPYSETEHRDAPHPNRRNRNSYYVFRQGSLQMQVFGRQAIEW